MEACQHKGWQVGMSAKKDSPFACQHKRKVYGSVNKIVGCVAQSTQKDGVWVKSVGLSTQNDGVWGKRAECLSVNTKGQYVGMSTQKDSVWACQHKRMMSVPVNTKGQCVGLSTQKGGWACEHKRTGCV